MFLVFFFLVVGVCAAMAITKKALKVLASLLVVVVTGFSGLKILQEKSDKRWTALFPHEEVVPDRVIAPSPLSSPVPTATPEPIPTPDVWEQQFRSRHSLFGMPDKILQYYPADFVFPAEIRCRLEYRPNLPWPPQLIVYIPDKPLGMRSKEVVACAQYVTDDSIEIVDSIVADARSD